MKNSIIIILICYLVCTIIPHPSRIDQFSLKKDYDDIEKDLIKQNIFVSVNKDLGFIWTPGTGYMEYNEMTAIKIWSHNGGNRNILPIEFAFGSGKVDVIGNGWEITPNSTFKQHTASVK